MELPTMNRTDELMDVGYQKVILLVMLSIFSVVGSVGNAMVVFVFQRVREKTTAQVFIITMAVIDLFTCMVIIPFTMVVEYTDFNIKYDFFCKLYHFFVTSKVPLSAFIMVAIAFDRYFCICHPLKRIMTLKRVKITVVLLFLLACTLGLITSLFYSVYQAIEKIDAAKIDAVLGPNFTQSIVNLDKLSMWISLSAYTDNCDDPKQEEYISEGKKIIATLREHNVSFNGVDNASFPVVIEVVYGGICDTSAVNVGKDFFNAYQPIHIAVWPVCLVTVVVLYMLIYRFMCLRRSKKLQQKLIMCAYVNGDGNYESTRLVNGDLEEKRTDGSDKKRSASSTVDANPTSHFEHGMSTVIVNTTSSCHNAETRLLAEQNAESEKHGKSLLVGATPKNKTLVAVTMTHSEDNVRMLNSFYDDRSSGNNNNDAISTDRGRRHSHLPEQKFHWHKNRDSVKRYKGRSKRCMSQLSCETNRLRDENRSANVRTALMLFTVTIVFVVAFVPAMLMAQRIISYNLVVFYIYFIYNVANPFIYAFMNHIFKDYMRKMFTCKDGKETPKRAHSTVLTL